MIWIKVNAFDAYARVAKVEEKEEALDAKFSLVDVQTLPEKIAATGADYVLITTDFLNLGQDLKNKIEEENCKKYNNNNMKVEVQRV